MLTDMFSKSRHLNLEGFTDWHSHILPGVDDGVQEMQKSLKILQSYEDAGIDEVWLTPHIMEDIPNTTDGLRARFAELQSAYSGPVKLHLASENMMDKVLLERLETDDLLPIGPEGNMLLVETSYFNAPMGMHDTLRKVMSKGYFPLLAHPERYNYITSMDEYRKMRDMGVRFQINLMSLCGHYGPVVRDKAVKLVKEGMCEHLGSDLHRRAHYEVIKHTKLKPSLLRRLSELSGENL